MHARCAELDGPCPRRGARWTDEVPDRQIICLPTDGRRWICSSGRPLLLDFTLVARSGRATEATIKALFAVSSNRCAFPQCPNPLVEPVSKKVTGRICHIKAASPKGLRYDPLQSEKDRHGPNNLILLCPIHHDVVDADEKTYTVGRLHMLKADHERRLETVPSLTDAQVKQFSGSGVLILPAPRAEGYGTVTSPSQKGFPWKLFRWLAADGIRHHLRLCYYPVPQPWAKSR